MRASRIKSLAIHLNLPCQQPNTALHRTPPVPVLCEVGWLCSSGVAGERPRWAAGKWRRLAERGKTNT